MKNRQTYLSKEDREFLISATKLEIEKLMKEKLSAQSIKRIASLQSLVERLEAKL